MTSMMRRSCWALAGFLTLGGLSAPTGMMVFAGTDVEEPIVDPSGDIVSNATMSTQARLDAYQNLATFLLTQFQFDIQQVVDTRREAKRIDRLIKQVTKTLDKEERDAEKDIKSIIKDAKRALRHTGGGSANGQLNELQRQRLDELEAIRSTATAAMYDILAAQTG